MDESSGEERSEGPDWKVCKLRARDFKNLL